MGLKMLPFLSLLSLVALTNLMSYYPSLSSWAVVSESNSPLLWSMSWVVMGILCLPSSFHLPVLSSSLFVSLFYLCDSLIWFFVLFELSVVPMFLLLLSKGLYPERLGAAKFLLFYTILSSVPLLLYFIHSAYFWGSASLILGGMETSPHPLPMGVLGFGSVAFLVKLPLFLLHFWLLKAHVESPLVGSMFLAGVLLKMGALGLIRIFSFYPPSLEVVSFLFGVALWGAVVSSVLSLTSPDVKLSVAYASVSHMNLGLAAFVFLKDISLSGFMAAMVAHSFSSPLLFYMVTLGYELVGTRSKILLKNCLSESSIVGFLSFWCWSSNLGIPPFMGAWGEVLSVSIFSTVCCVALAPLVMYVVFGSAFSMMSFTLFSHSFPSRPVAFYPSCETAVATLVLSFPQLVGFVSMGFIS